MLSQEVSVTPERLSEIPTGPGIYMFWGSPTVGGKARVLYVGKSKNLRSRVRHYFQGAGDGRTFIHFIQKHTQEIRTILVSNEDQALILENEVIKKYKPPYNILLKDDKRYLSIRIDFKHEWPKMEMVRRIRKDSAFYLGPFSSATHLKTTLDFMQKIFQLRTCTDHKLYNRSRPCIEYDIKRCTAPCVQLIEKPRYDELVAAAIQFLKGNEEDVLAHLKIQMDLAAQNDNFEEAARLRDRIRAIETTLASQQIIGSQQAQREMNQDILGFAEQEGRAVIALVFLRHGILLDKRLFEFEAENRDRDSLILEFLNRYYSGEVFLPDEILVPHLLDTDLIEIDIPVRIPRSEEKRRFLSLAEDNAKSHLTAALLRKQKADSALSALQRLLHLERYPQRIDCFDISHHQGLENVASVVRFYDGVADRSFYRRMKISQDIVDDFASMKEALSRRYKTPDDLPDLIIIDGGKGQLAAAIESLKLMDFKNKTDIVGLAKARERPEEKIDPLNPMNRERIFKPGQKNPILLKEDSPEELLLRRIRDEAHRFAITFHRERKVKSLTRSALDEIPGLTERLKTQLLKRFQSVDQIIHATDHELLEEIPLRVVKAPRLTLKNALVKMNE